MLPPAAALPFGPLWFLAAYLVVVAVAPGTVWLQRRVGLLVPAAMALVTVLVDLVGFGLGHPRVRYLNIAPVLLLPHQLGYAYADGSMQRWPRRALWAMVAVGLGGLVLLTNPWVFLPFGGTRFRWFPTIGHYPRSLLGTDVEPISDAYPPTVCFLLAGIWAIGAVMLLRPALVRWVARPGPWKATIFVNGIIMTLFLWHMTACLLAILARVRPYPGGMASTAPVEVDRPRGEGDVEPDVPWVVIVWNDPINLMSYVVWVFQKLFGYSREKATKLMLDVHHKGRAVVSHGTREKCEHDVARLHAHGLWATMQKDR